MPELISPPSAPRPWERSSLGPKGRPDPVLNVLAIAMLGSLLVMVAAALWMHSMAPMRLLTPISWLFLAPILFRQNQRSAKPMPRWGRYAFGVWFVFAAGFLLLSIGLLATGHL